MPRLSACLSPVPDSVFRRRLSAVREELHALEGRVSPELGGDLSGVLEAIEQTLIARFGWDYPEPLPARDQAVLAAAGAL